MPAPTNNTFQLPKSLELERIVTLEQAADLRGTSIDSLKRHDAAHIIELSPRRRGMRLKHALKIEG